MRAFVLAVLLWFAFVPGARAGDAALEPFVAEYDVHYGSMDVGSSRTEILRGGEPGRWIIESRSDASGLARLVASGTLVQRSSFEIDGGSLRPISYRFDDGTKRTSVTLGTDLTAGERPQAVVPAGAWQAAHSLGNWTLVGCTVAPGFDFAGFELAPKGWRPAR